MSASQSREDFGVKVVSPADMAEMYGSEYFDDCNSHLDWIGMLTDEKRKVMTDELYKWCKYFIARADNAKMKSSILSLNFLLNFASQITAHSGFWVKSYRMMDRISLGVSEDGYYFTRLDLFERIAQFKDGKIPDSSDL